LFKGIFCTTYSFTYKYSHNIHSAHYRDAKTKGAATKREEKSEKERETPEEEEEEEESVGEDVVEGEESEAHAGSSVLCAKQSLRASLTVLDNCTNAQYSSKHEANRHVLL